MIVLTHRQAEVLGHILSNRVQTGTVEVKVQQTRAIVGPAKHPDVRVSTTMGQKWVIGPRGALKNG